MSDPIEVGLRRHYLIVDSLKAAGVSDDKMIEISRWVDELCAAAVVNALETTMTDEPARREIVKQARGKYEARWK